jgi:hypothetical protein
VPVVADVAGEIDDDDAVVLLPQAMYDGVEPGMCGHLVAADDADGAGAEEGRGGAEDGADGVAPGEMELFFFCGSARGDAEPVIAHAESDVDEVGEVPYPDPIPRVPCEMGVVWDVEVGDVDQAGVVKVESGLVEEGGEVDGESVGAQSGEEGGEAELDELGIVGVDPARE